MRGLWRVALPFVAAMAAMATPSPEQGAAKWSQRLQQSTQQMQEGVARVQTSPGAAAAAAADLWFQRVSNAREKFRRKVGAVSLGEWQSAMQTLGIPRAAQGAQQKQGKYAAFASTFYPVAQQVSEQVKRMPKGDIEQSLARVRAAITAFHQFGQQGRG